MRFAAVEKVWDPDRSWELKAGPSVEGYAVIAGRTAVAVGTNVLARSKVVFLGVRVGVLSVVGAAIMRDPVPAPLVTSIMATDMKRVPDVEAGIKFSFAEPLCDHSMRLFVASTSWLVLGVCGYEICYVYRDVNYSHDAASNISRIVS